MTKQPVAGAPHRIADGLTTILAPNASPMTYWGTNSYILGHDTLAVIDPGPASPEHLAALITAIDGRTVSHILITHSHLDHSPLAKPLSDVTGAPILAFGDSTAGRSDVMVEFAATGLMGGGEGVDHDFKPDICLKDGEDIIGDGWALKALHTPGHFGNHLTFRWENAAFTGDHLMGWATSLVSPPDGDLTDFMASCRKLAKYPIKHGFCGHGAPIEDVPQRLKFLMSHRIGREEEILTALTSPQTAKELTALIYTDVAPALLPMAERNVLAHLVDLWGRNLVAPIEELNANSKFIRK